MKKIISILTVSLFAVCITKAQVTIRSLKVGEWKKTLETNITYKVVSNGNSIEIKEGGINLHSFTMPDSLKFSNSATIDEGIIIKGVKWATRNLASHGKFVEKPEDYGALFQWGRKGDGHEQRTSHNYPTNDNSQENGVVSGTGLDAHGQIVSSHAAYGKFIKQSEEPRDWRTPQNDALWNSGSETVPIKTTNDPCPAGWRVPTLAELISLRDSGSEWDESNGVSGRFFGDGANKLFLPAAGIRGCGNGEVANSDDIGYYWSSRVGYSQVGYLHFTSGGVFQYTFFRAHGLSVRCVAE